MEEGKKIVMIAAFRDFRDEEYFIPKEEMEIAGIEVKTASNKIGIALGAEGGEAKVDFLVKDLNPADFQAVVFVGGPGCLENLDNEDSYKVAKETVSQGKVLAAICISPVILAKAGVLKGKRATVWDSPMGRRPVVKILEENGAIFEDKAVVVAEASPHLPSHSVKPSSAVDGNIITANGPAAAKEFAGNIIKALTSI